MDNIVSPDTNPTAEVGLRNKITIRELPTIDTLSAKITRDASTQTFYTIRFLVDRALVPNAYRAYAYFRWVDDCLDQQLSDRAERIAFLERQQKLVKCLYL